MGIFQLQRRNARQGRRSCTLWSQSRMEMTLRRFSNWMPRLFREQTAWFQGKKKNTHTQKNTFWRDYVTSSQKDDHISQPMRRARSQERQSGEAQAPPAQGQRVQSRGERAPPSHSQVLHYCVPGTGYSRQNLPCPCPVTRALLLPLDQGLQGEGPSPPS